MAGTLRAAPPATIRDRVNTWLAGEHPDWLTKHIVDGFIGKSGEKAGLIDFTPLGIPFNAYEAGRSGAKHDWLNAGLSALGTLGGAGGLFGRGAKAARAVEEAAPAVRMATEANAVEGDAGSARILSEALARAHENTLRDLTAAGVDVKMVPTPKDPFSVSDEVTGTGRFGFGLPNNQLGGAPQDFAGVNPKMVVARRKPDGTIQYGEPGQVHADLLSDAELDAIPDSEDEISPFHKDEDFGYAYPGGKFLDRKAALLEKPPGVSRRNFLGGAAAVAAAGAAAPLVKLIPAAEHVAAPVAEDATAALIAAHEQGIAAHRAAMEAHNRAYDMIMNADMFDMPEEKIIDLQRTAHGASLDATTHTGGMAQDLNAESGMIPVDNTGETEGLQSAHGHSLAAESFSHEATNGTGADVGKVGDFTNPNWEEAALAHEGASGAHGNAVIAHLSALRHLHPEMGDAAWGRYLDKHLGDLKL